MCELCTHWDLDKRRNCEGLIFAPCAIKGPAYITEDKYSCKSFEKKEKPPVGRPGAA